MWKGNWCKHKLLFISLALLIVKTLPEEEIDHMKGYNLYSVLLSCQVESSVVLCVINRWYVEIYSSASSTSLTTVSGKQTTPGALLLYEPKLGVIILQKFVSQMVC